MALRTRAWSAGRLFKLLVLGTGLLVTYLLFAAAAMRVALRAREVQVPNLTDRTMNEATAIAADLGLTLKVDDTRRTDPKVAAGRVLAQEPAAGSTARRQRTLKVWLSAGQKSTTVPLLIGETERTAQLRLSQDGLMLSDVAEIRSQNFAPDVIVAQTPPAKTVAGRVALLVNRGERGASYVMPDLIGVNGDRAAEILRDRGFRVAVVGAMPYPGIAAGVVIRQSPQAGFQIGPGEPISLEVSR
jgi:beta-lactam-binding protein with PASTA domain